MWLWVTSAKRGGNGGDGWWYCDSGRWQVRRHCLPCATLQTIKCVKMRQIYSLVSINVVKLLFLRH